MTTHEQAALVKALLKRARRVLSNVTATTSRAERDGMPGLIEEIDAVLANPPAAPVAAQATSAQVEAVIDEYLTSYATEYDEGSVTPGDDEKFVIKDAIMGLLADDEWLALHAAAPKPSAQPPSAALAERQGVPDRWREAVQRLVTGFEHVSGIARLWEPDHSSGADRAKWARATEACADVARLLAQPSAVPAEDVVRDAARYRVIRDDRESQVPHGGGVVYDVYDDDGTLLYGEALDEACDRIRLAKVRNRRRARRHRSLPGAAMSRIVAQFSCGAASAVATKLAIAQHPHVEIINAFLLEEHPDNRRFTADCERWFGQPVTVLRDERDGASVIRVFRRKRFMMGPRGAPCSGALKRELLNRWAQPGDVMVFGYTAEEADRLDDFRERNPERPVIAPLIDAGLTKDDCKAMVERAGIVLPAMYLLGYDNANCIGCVKGGEGYWRAIREDFPEVFETNCMVQDEIGPGSWFLRYRSGPRNGERFPLRELPAGEPRRNEKLPSCSFFCEIAEQEYAA